MVGEPHKDVATYTPVEDDLYTLDALNDEYTRRRQDNLEILETAIKQKRDILLGNDIDACRSVLELMTVHDRLMTNTEKSRAARAAVKIKVKEAAQTDRTNAMVLDMFQLIATGHAPIVKVPTASVEDVDAAKVIILDELAAEGVVVQEAELRVSPDDLS